ncbi:L-lactate MFS transporter [Anaerosolibacter sp.]|uniref:L-lactate MFS transporter n=1 Tax=Anaerosolibacter sp. TaxID=1872527 RepID=UPI0039EFAE80
MKSKNNAGWLVVFGAILIQICIGAVYSWSLFNEPLMEKFGWSENDVVFTFSIVIFIFAFTTIFSGRLQDKIGPKKVSLIGGIVYGIGLILTSTATSIAQLHIYYGVVAGIGIGFCYVCPLSTCVKWFPDKKGLITGITVGAFGLGSFVFKSVIQTLLSLKGVSQTFLYVGIIYLLLIVIGAQFLKLPIKDDFSKFKEENTTLEENNYTLSEMIKTKTFITLWIMFLLGTMSGLLVIGLAKDIGVQLAGLAPSVAANVVAIIALFNASGRIIWGALSDKLGRIKVVVILFVITSASMFYMSFITLHFLNFFIAVASIAFCFGGFLAVFPTITGDFYGMKNLGANYGIVYQAYGISAIIGPIIAANTGSLITTFIIAGIFSVVGIILTLTIRVPKRI